MYALFPIYEAIPRYRGYSRNGEVARHGTLLQNVTSSSRPCGLYESTAGRSFGLALICDQIGLKGIPKRPRLA